MWAPDVYEGAPTAVTLLIGGAPKLAAMIAMGGFQKWKKGLFAEDDIEPLARMPIGTWTDIIVKKKYRNNLVWKEKVQYPIFFILN